MDFAVVALDRFWLTFNHPFAPQEVSNYTTPHAGFSRVGIDLNLFLVDIESSSLHDGLCRGGVTPFVVDFQSCVCPPQVSNYTTPNTGFSRVGIDLNRMWTISNHTSIHTEFCQCWSTLCRCRPHGILDDGLKLCQLSHWTLPMLASNSTICS